MHVKTTSYVEALGNLTQLDFFLFLTTKNKAFTCFIYQNDKTLSLGFVKIVITSSC